MKNRKNISSPLHSTGIIFFLVIFLLLPITQSFAASKKPIKWKVLSSWAQNFKTYEYQLDRWINAINTQLKGHIEITEIRGPETIPPFEQLKALRMGLFDVLWTHPAYHAGDLGLGMGMDLFFASASQRAKAGAHQLLEEAYRKTQNTHYLTSGPDGTGYHLMLKDQCITKADLKGFKIRTNPFYDPLVGALGGATVKIAGGEVYSAIEKGVVDGATWPAFGAIDFKWYEVSKHMVRPRFGEVVYCFLVNLDKWNQLDQNLREKITEISIKVMDEAREAIAKKWKDEEQALIRHGMQKCTLPGNEAKKYLNTFDEATWKFITRLSPDDGPKLKAIAAQFK